MCLPNASSISKIINPKILNRTVYYLQQLQQINYSFTFCLWYNKAHVLIYQCVPIMRAPISHNYPR